MTTNAHHYQGDISRRMRISQVFSWLEIQYAALSREFVCITGTIIFWGYFNTEYNYYFPEEEWSILLT